MNPSETQSEASSTESLFSLFPPPQVMATAAAYFCFRPVTSTGVSSQPTGDMLAVIRKKKTKNMEVGVAVGALWPPQRRSIVWVE